MPHGVQADGERVLGVVGAEPRRRPRDHALVKDRGLAGELRRLVEVLEREHDVREGIAAKAALRRAHPCKLVLARAFIDAACAAQAEAIDGSKLGLVAVVATIQLGAQGDDRVGVVGRGGLRFEERDDGVAQPEQLTQLAFLRLRYGVRDLAMLLEHAKRGTLDR
jgi:hypothetical protein